MTSDRHPARAALAMLGAIAAFSLMDAAMKELSAHYPQMQVTMLRGAASLPFVLAWVLQSAGLRAVLPRRWAPQLLRGLLGIAMIWCFVHGLRQMPLSTAYTIYFVSPLLVAMLSVPLLGEKVGPRRWTAIGIGLVGVIVVLRPGTAGLISVPGLAVLAAALSYAIASVLVSRLARSETPQSLVVCFLVVMALGAGIMAAPDWVPLRAADLWLIAGMGLAGALGQIGLTHAFRLGEASMVAPLEYAGLLFVLAWDWLFWQTLPDRATWIGAAIIVVSGLYLMRRERVRRVEHPASQDHP